MIAMHSRPEVAALDAVERSSVNVKITGNMMELKSPTASAAYAATPPLLCVTVRHSTAATSVKSVSSRGAGTFSSSALPRKRPTIAPIQ